MQQAIDSFRDEHTLVLKKLDALEGIYLHPNKNPETTTELKVLVAFFQTDFWVHFTKEEEAIFPEIEKFMPRDSGPLGVMLAEHEDLRSINSKLQDALQSFFSGSDDAGSVELMKEYGSRFTGILRAHIDKENGILFVMAERHLSPTQKENTSRLFVEIDARQRLVAR